MEIIDRIYGKWMIEEKVLVELLNSPSIVRLKDVGQYGVPNEYYPHFPSYSRFEHSVGVMLLLRKLGASLDEQVAGLLHDVSHTAFSHVVDYALGDGDKQDYQDNRHRSVILSSELPELLRRHEINVDTVIDYQHFTLLERPAPQLCADRVDYALRAFADWADPDGVGLCVENLVVIDGSIGFAAKEAAERFRAGYAACQEEHWGGLDSRLRYCIFAEIIRWALAKRYISIEDLSLTDEAVMKLLRAANDQYIIDRLSLLTGPLRPETINYYTSLLPKNKFRYVDPSFVLDSKIYTLSEAIA